MNKSAKWPTTPRRKCSARWPARSGAEITLRVATRDLTLATRKPTADDVEKSKAIVADRPRSPSRRREIYAAMEILIAMMLTTITMPTHRLPHRRPGHRRLAQRGLRRLRPRVEKRFADPAHVHHLPGEWLVRLPAHARATPPRRLRDRSLAGYLEVGAEPKITAKYPRCWGVGEEIVLGTQCIVLGRDETRRRMALVAALAPPSNDLSSYRRKEEGAATTVVKDLQYQPFFKTHLPCRKRQRNRQRTQMKKRYWRSFGKLRMTACFFDAPPFHHRRDSASHFRLLSLQLP